MKSRQFGAALLTILTACSSTSRYIPRETSEEVVVLHLDAPDVEPVEIDQAAFTKALTSLVQDIQPSADPRATAQKLFPIPAGRARGTIEVYPADSDGKPLVDAYLGWCQRTQALGDCLGLLTDDKRLDHEDRKTLALAIALDSVLNETKEVLAASIKDSLEPQALLKSLIWSICMYMAMWLVPEPVSKGIAAVLTAALLSYLGVHTVWSLVGGWRQLDEAVEYPSSFKAIQSAGEKYGKLLGKNAARILVMVVTTAVGGVTSRLGARLGKMPASSQASKIAQAQGSVPAVAAAEVEAVAISSQGTFRIARSLTSRIMGRLWRYPQVIDPRTGRNISFPVGSLRRVPKSQRVPWSNQERGAFIQEWHRRGYPVPKGGWDKYDIHHVHPRELGGTNDFWNLVPVERKTHQELLNTFWREFLE
jgi:hypothetical protein